MSKRAVVLLSGGIDSSVCAGLAAQELGNGNVYPLSIFYDQKHDREIEAAKNIAILLKLNPIRTICLGDLYAGSRSNLIDPKLDLPHSTYEELQEQEGPSPTYVPYRNGLFLSAAAVYALNIDADFIYYGAHAEDARNWAYPDCSPEFNGAMMNAIYIGTYSKLRLLTPLQWLTKLEIVKLGLDLKIPFEFTYSCYTGREHHCGLCSTCVSRINAFKVAQHRDPVEYEIDVKWGPITINLNE